MSTIDEPQITLDDLNVIWNDEDGLPIFTSDRDDICDIVESLGFQIYYLIGNNVEIHKETVKTHENGKQVQKPIEFETRSFQIFKVVNNFVGRCIRKSDITLPGLSDIATLAHYNMPLIPHVIVEKLDQFFRLVHAQHGTESIVMLTYDTTKEGPEGWGVLVPDQENTAAHCNYDPHSVAQVKPDHVLIVGSVHSHPNMSAYASGTDHEDQADFDGIHITYGWQKSVNNGATQYHLEMQMAGQAYTLRPQDVFEDFTLNKDPDPDVVEWSGKVKKELPLSVTAGVTPELIPFPARQEMEQLPGFLASDNSYETLKWVINLSSVMKDCDVPFGSVLVGEINTTGLTNDICPSCESIVDSFNVSDGFCDICYLPLIAKGSSYQDAIEVAENYSTAASIDPYSAIYLIGSDNSSSVFVMEIRPALKSSADAFVSDIEEDVTLCCGVSIQDISTCFCTPSVTYDNFLEYENIISDHEIYHKSQKGCIECANYYTSACPRLKSMLFQFVSNPAEHLNALATGQYDKITDIGCSHFDYYNPDSYLYDMDVYS